MPPTLTKHASNLEGEDLSEPLDVTSLEELRRAKVTLFEFDQSPPCWKVRALLHYYEIPYTSVTAYPGQKVEGLDDQYKKIPKLVINDKQINDSAVVFRTLSPLITGEKLSAREVELEKRNNISGLLGALEKETISSFSGIVAATRELTSSWRSWSFSLIKPVLPFVAGAVVLPLGTLAAMRMPHGKDGPSLEHGRAFREALGEQPFFHGASLGPLDLSLYGTMACFIKMFAAPQAHAVLDTCDLRAWYERCDEAVGAVRPLMG